MIRWTVSVVALVSLVLTGCSQTSSDPDQVIRDMMTAHTWITDDTQTNTVSMVLTLKSDGTGLMDQMPVKWSYANKIFTLTRTSDSASWSTTDPTLTDKKFNITWENGLCYLIASSG